MVESLEILKKTTSTIIEINKVSNERVYQFKRTQYAVKNWIEEVLDIKGKLEEDLILSLKSGVILCYLMLEIEERSIPRIQENTGKLLFFKKKIMFLNNFFIRS